jgi:HSP20 family protein
MTLVRTTNPLAKSFDGLMNELFNEFPTNFGRNVKENIFQFPPVNIIEKTGSYQLEMAVPGMQKTDFNIKLDGSLLTISAEKKEVVNDENAKSIKKEFSQKAFKRSFNLDEKIDAANISAKYEQGILSIELPKKAEIKENSKEITIL